MFDKLICAISIICLAVDLVLVLVLKDSLRTYFKSLPLSWSLGVRSLSLSLQGQVQEVLVLVLVLGVRSLSLSWSLGVKSLLTSLVEAKIVVCGTLWINHEFPHDSELVLFVLLWTLFSCLS